MSGPAPSSNQPSDPAHPTIYLISELFPGLIEECRAKAAARRQIPQELIDLFAHYMTDLRPSLLNDHPELVGSWLLIKRSQWTLVSTECSVSQLLQDFPSASLTGREVSFLIRLGKEFNSMDGGHVGVATSSGNVRRLYADVNVELSDCTGKETLRMVVANMLIDTGADDVLVFNYSAVLDSGLLFPVMFGAESGPSEALCPSMSLISNPRVGIFEHRCFHVPRIVIPFDLSLTWKLYRYLADAVLPSVVQNGEQSTACFLDESVSVDSALTGKLLQWLSEPFRVPEDPDLRRVLLAKGLSLSEGARNQGLLGLSFLRQTEFCYSPTEGSLTFLP